MREDKKQQPRYFLTVPAHFGRRPDVVLAREPGNPHEAAAAAAALAQHAAALSAVDELTRRGLSIRDFGAMVGENHDHLRRKLYGQAVASLEDTHLWARVLADYVPAEVRQ